MPTALEVCDDDADGVAEFNLGDSEAEVIGAQTGVVVTYHSTPEGAADGSGVLPTLYTNTDPFTEEVYVRIENAAGCYDTTTLQLIVNPLPTVVAVSPYELCDDDNPGDEQEQFDLTDKEAEILNGQTNVTVSYYASQADADTNTNAITVPYTNTSNPQEIIAVLTNTNTGCSSQVTFDLVVNPLPALVALTPLEVCDDGTPDGLTEIDLSIKNIEISGNNPGYSVSYYLNLADAQAEANPLAIPYTNISNPQTIFVRVEDTTTGCYDTTTLDLVVEQAPVANEPTPLRYCDPDNDGFGVFTLTDADNEITGGIAGLTVTYHETFANAENGVDAVDTTVDYNNIVVDTQTLYARVESATIATDCATIVELQLIVEPTPQIIEPTPLEECDDVSADGFATFDLTSKAEELLNGLDPAQYAVSYYETEDNANQANNPIANPAAYTNTTANTQIIWIRVEDTNTVEGCYKVISLELIVNPLPVLVQPMPLELCDVNNPGDEQEAFTLENAEAEILNGQNGITLTYYETQMDADNATNPIVSPYVNTSNAQTIYVRAENDVTGCYSTITVTLRVDPIPSPEPDPDPIEVCDDDNDGFAEFDLEIRTVEITNGEPDVVITYHETQEEAEQGINAIIGLYTNIVADSQMIYVRSENTITGCYSLTQNTLELIVVPSPEVPTNLDPLEICDDNNDGIAQFDLTQRDADILGTQDPTEVTLTYHVTAADAETGNNPIINEGNYTNTINPQTIYVRLYNPTTGCQDTGEFEIIVQLPPEPVQPTPLELCDDLDEVPGDEMTVFDLTVKDTEITGGNASWDVDYYETNADAQAQTNVIADPTQYTNSSVNGLPANPQTLYVVVTDTDTGCVAYTTMTIRVLPNPTPTPSGQLPDLELCDDTNTGDGVEVFDLTENEVLILNGEAGVTPTYHETSEDAYAGENAIADPTQYTNVDTPAQDIYVRVTNDVTGCYAVVDFTIHVYPLPEVVAVTDFIQCELNTDGFDSFDLTTKDEEVLNGQDPTRYIVTYHETLADAEAEMNALVSPYTNISNPQEIYVTITDNVTGCSISTQRFNLQVDEAAQANPDMVDIIYEECDDNVETDGDPSNDSTQFTLSTQDEFILDGQDPANYIVTYFATEDDANLNVNPLPDLYENVANPQVIYARVDNNTLAVIPIALDLTALTAGLDLDANGTIDTYDTDADGVFDLIDVDGDGLSDGIDANADGLYEFVDIDGDGNGDPVDLNNDGVFDNQQDGSICYEVAALTLQVNPRPYFDLEDSYILCVDTNGTEILDPLVLDTGLSDTDYSFVWTFNGEVITTETSSSMMPTQGGTYGVTVTDITTSTVTNCETYDETVVVESAPPTLIAEVVTQVFGNSNVIEALATGISEYEYSLDGGPWMDPSEDGSIQFTGVSQGLHTVTARDKNGCGIATQEVFVIDYPKYFTPNGDGIHETWNIEGIGGNAKIYIFDRYGKLLKQISPEGQGWDGTFNGNNMPSSDYWFTVEYEEPLTNQIKEFKAHFTLKR
jgi:gliding motility-associated-like protein